jgi:DNA-binding NarL/FixJ family response regulator
LPRSLPADEIVLKIFVVDDHAVIRDGIRLICGSADDLIFTGGASTLDEAIAGIERARPDVVLVDLNVPPESGLDLIPAVAGRWPEIKMVVLSVDKDEGMALEALNAGAAGYVTKDVSLLDVVGAVRRAAEGEAVVEGISTGHLLNRFVSFAAEAARSARILVELSPREREVLALVAQGRSNQQIATALGISDRTVASHVSSIYRKLGVSNRVDAARQAMRLGLVEH